MTVLQTLDTQKVCTILSDRGLIQLVREPAHRRGHILHWLVAPEGSTLIHDVAVPDNAFSDHKTLSFSVHWTSADLSDRSMWLTLSEPPESTFRQIPERRESLVTPC